MVVFPRAFSEPAQHVLLLFYSDIVFLHLSYSRENSSKKLYRNEERKFYNFSESKYFLSDSKKHTIVKSLALFYKFPM